MKYEQQINAWFEKFEHRFETSVPNIVAETATEFFQDSFKKQSWDNVPWKALSAKYAAKKTRGRGRILTASGILQRSIHPSMITPNRVRISAGNSRVPYARIHNEGLTVKGTAKVRPFTNRNFMGKGKPVKIKAHTRSFSFTMPRRQYMGHSKFLNPIIKDRLIKAFNK